MKTINKHGSKQGFTLIELLVVISIIALLVGILLPALGAARRSAQSAVCLGNLRSAGQAMATYASSNRDWLAGPNTSGAKIDNGYVWGMNSTEPTQNMDWVSPTMGDALGLPADKEDRILAIFNNEFKCPANQELYGPTVYSGHSPNGVPADSINVNSYSAMLGFHLDGTGKGVGLDGQRGNVLTIPNNYAPRLDMVGSASGKVYAMDGVRYLNGDVMSFNGINFQVQGGNYMSNGPAFALGGDPYQFESGSLTPNAASLRYAYRHNGAVNSSFFDGHGETLSAEDSVDLNLYYPTGTKVGSGVGHTNDSDFEGNVIR